MSTLKADIEAIVNAIGDAISKTEALDAIDALVEKAVAELAALKAQPSPWQDSFGNPVDVLFSVNAALARAGSPHRIDCLNGQAVTVPVPECLSSVQATPEPPSPSTVEEVTLRRCPAMSPKGATPSGEFPMDGAQCGMNEGHGGAHSLLIPTGFPWSSPSPEPASSYGQSRSMNKRLEIMGAPLPEGMVLNDAKDLVPSSSASALPENQDAPEAK